MAVLHLLEREELQKLQKKWWYDKGECVVESDKVRSRYFVFFFTFMIVINIIVIQADDDVSIRDSGFTGD